MSDTKELQDAIYNALCAAETLSGALREAEAAVDICGEWIAHLNGLREGTLAACSFSSETTASLRVLAAGLEPAIREETTTWFARDEGDMSGGREETAATAEGAALIRLQSALGSLADRLSDAVRLRKAEQLARALRE